MRLQGWRRVKPYGDCRKLPVDWEQRWRLFILRIAYFVAQFKIPQTLVVNYDQTGFHFVTMKGSTWVDPFDAAYRRDGSVVGVQGANDKRQCTGVVGIAADGLMCPGQIIWQGKSARSLPYYTKSTYVGDQTTGYSFSIYAPDDIKAETRKWIPHQAATSNHWSNVVSW